MLFCKFHKREYILLKKIRSHFCITIIRERNRETGKVQARSSHQELSCKTFVPDFLFNKITGQHPAT